MKYDFDKDEALQEVREFQSNLYEFLGRHSDHTPQKMLVMSACLIKCAIEMYSTVMPDEDIRFTIEEMIKDIPLTPWKEPLNQLLNDGTISVKKEILNISS